mmetsp:Transcript_16748/g.33336  ORF Transcript_16748/g.33336 Transcript_16748/m.33336 type:complete len:229 (+) Transcript_16748:41-727(+)
MNMTMMILIVGLSFCLETMSLHSRTPLNLVRGQRGNSAQIQRRGFLTQTATTAAVIHATSFARPPPSNAEQLAFSISSSGTMQYADAKIGTGPPPEMGAPVAIDYIMSTTGAARGTRLYSTTDPDHRSPYRWVIGDGSTIGGLERAVTGGDGVPPMRPGGVRRVIVAPAGMDTLGYDTRECAKGKGPGPTPRGETYQRFKNVFCNGQRPVVPELVFDVKLLPYDRSWH